MQIKSTKSKSQKYHETTNYVNVYLCVEWQIRQDLKAIVRGANIYAETSQECSALESYCQSSAPLTGRHLMYFQQEGT